MLVGEIALDQDHLRAALLEQVDRRGGFLGGVAAADERDAGSSLVDEPLGHHEAERAQTTREEVGRVRADGRSRLRRGEWRERNEASDEALIATMGDLILAIHGQQVGVEPVEAVGLLLGIQVDARAVQARLLVGEHAAESPERRLRRGAATGFDGLAAAGHQPKPSIRTAGTRERPAERQRTSERSVDSVVQFAACARCDGSVEGPEVDHPHRHVVLAGCSRR